MTVRIWQNSSHCIPKIGCFIVCELYLNNIDYKKIVMIHTLLYLKITKRTLKQAFLSFKFEHLLHNTQIKVWGKLPQKRYSRHCFHHLLIHLKIQLNKIWYLLEPVQICYRKKQITKYYSFILNHNNLSYKNSSLSVFHNALQ